MANRSVLQIRLDEELRKSFHIACLKNCEKMSNVLKIYIVAYVQKGKNVKA